jgi:glycosyltransferase involved in cell wall biosynthesis
MAELPVSLIYSRFTHHAIHSGYDQLAKYLGKPLLQLRGVHRLVRLCHLDEYVIKRSGMRWYNGFYGELTAAIDMLWRGQRLYHFLYGENGYRFLCNARWSRKHKVICTFHVPPNVFTEVMYNVEHLKRLDAVTIVAHNQWDTLASIVGEERVFFVPHGIDTQFFRPAKPALRDSHRTCLCVGHHMRDLATLFEVARIVGMQVPEVRFVLVDSVFFKDKSMDVQHYLDQFETLPNFELRTDVNEADLLKMYQTSDLLVLPLHDSTATNSLLEGIACGLPIVTTDVGGVRDYVDDNCAVLVPPQDSEAMAEQVLHLLNDESRRKTLAEKSRKRALQFDWAVIAEQMRQVYCQVWNS